MKKFRWTVALLFSLALAPPAEARHFHGPVMHATSQMQEFVRAVKTRNPALFLTLVSHSKGLRWVNTIPMSGPPGDKTKTVSYATLARSFRKHGEYYEQYFDSSAGTEADPQFYDKIKRIGMSWRTRGRSEYYNDDAGMYIKWREENGRWVIAELGYPES